jgi:hypothetical protein
MEHDLTQAKVGIFVVSATVQALETGIGRREGSAEALAIGVINPGCFQGSGPAWPPTPRACTGGCHRGTPRCRVPMPAPRVVGSRTRIATGSDRVARHVTTPLRTKFQTRTETRKGAPGAAGCREKLKFEANGNACGRTCKRAPQQPLDCGGRMPPPCHRSSQKVRFSNGAGDVKCPAVAYSGFNECHVRIGSKRSPDGSQWTPSRRWNG